MKTPGEIKKGLKYCGAMYEWDGSCTGCPYERNDGECDGSMETDALAYINQLEETIGSMGHLNKTMYNEAKKGIQELETRLAQVERERDAAVCDINNSEPCFACYYFMRNKGTCKGGKRCCDEQFRASIGLSEYDGPEWKWRGVCEQNTKEE